MMELVKRQPEALRFASDALKDDREIVLEAVKQNGHALQDASAALQAASTFLLHRTQDSS